MLRHHRIQTCVFQNIAWVSVAKRFTSRDAYSMMLGRFKERVDIEMINVTGKAERLTVHWDVMCGWRKSAKCLLVCIHNANPKKQNHTRFLDTLDKLQAIHHPDNKYQLFCMYTHTPEAFEAMVGVTQMPGCPFTIHDRVDYSGYRCEMKARSPCRAAAHQFFNLPHDQKLPVDYVHIDGVFLTKTHAAVLYYQTKLSKRAIDFHAEQVRFAKSPLYATAMNSQGENIEWLHYARRQHQFMFIAAEFPCKQPLATELADYALTKNVTLFHKVPTGPNTPPAYQYIPPSAPPSASVGS